MKNRIFKNRVKKHREVGPGLGGLIQVNEKLFRGVFWGISLTALVLSVVNVRENAVIKTTNEIVSSVTQSEGQTSTSKSESISHNNYTYEDLNSVVTSQLGENVSEYVSSYISDYVTKNKITEKITEKDIVNIKSEISEDLVKKINESTTLTSNQELIVKGLVASMISDIKTEKIDYTKIDKSIEEQVTKLVEEKTAGIKLEKVEPYNDQELRGLINDNTKNVEKASLAIESQKTQINNINEAINNQSKSINLNNESIASCSSQTYTNATNIAANSQDILTAMNGVNKNTEDIQQNTTDISAIEAQLTSENGVQFKFGTDKGVYGYYVNGVFYPF